MLQKKTQVFFILCLFIWTNFVSCLLTIPRWFASWKSIDIRRICGFIWNIFSKFAFFKTIWFLHIPRNVKSIKPGKWISMHPRSIILQFFDTNYCSDRNNAFNCSPNVIPNSQFWNRSVWPISNVLNQWVWFNGNFFLSINFTFHWNLSNILINILVFLHSGDVTISNAIPITVLLQTCRSSIV